MQHSERLLGVGNSFTLTISVILWIWTVKSWITRPALSAVCCLTLFSFLTMTEDGVIGLLETRRNIILIDQTFFREVHFCVKIDSQCIETRRDKAVQPQYTDGARGIWRKRDNSFKISWSWAGLWESFTALSTFCFKSKPLRLEWRFSLKNYIAESPFYHTVNHKSLNTVKTRKTISLNYLLFFVTKLLQSQTCFY